MQTIHERTIEVLQRDFPQAKTKGFRKAVQRFQWEWEGKPDWKEFINSGDAWTEGMIPDLWFIDAECLSVVCIEVEHGNAVSNAKLDRYKRLWWLLDNVYLEAHLICSDRWGNLTPVPMHDMSLPVTMDKEHHLYNVVEAEREAKSTTFELTKVYCIRDQKARFEARKAWMEAHPSFCMEEFVKNDAEQCRAAGLPPYHCHVTECGQYPGATS